MAKSIKPLCGSMNLEKEKHWYLIVIAKFSMVCGYITGPCSIHLFHDCHFMSLIDFSKEWNPPEEFAH